MKRMISYLLAAVLVMACLPVVAFAAGNATVAIGSETAKAGDEVTIYVDITGDAFANYEMTISYDTSVLSLISIGGNGAIGNPKTGFVNWMTGNNVNSHGFSVTFKVADDAKSGTYPIDASVGFIADEILEDVAYTVVAGAVTIEGEPEPPVTEHVHDWSDWEVTTPATCTEAGVKTRTCACGETETREIPALGHTWGEWEVTKEATCVEAGVETRTCSVCGETETREIAMVAHNYGAWTFCGTDAKHEHKKVCSVCGDEVVADCNDKLQYTDEEKVEGGKNVTEYWQCADCGHEFTKTEFVEITEPTDPVVDPDLDDVPRTDDITGQVVMACAAALVAMMAAVAFVFKRKAAK